MRRIALVVGGLVTGLVVGSAGLAAAATPAAAATKPKPPKLQLQPAAKPFQEPRTYVPSGPLFNLPTGTLEQAGAIDLYLKRLIRNTPKGAEINVSLFRLQTKGMASALVEAHRKGVKVRVVLDTDSLKKKVETYDYLVKQLGTDMTKPSWVTLCPTTRGCIADKSKPDSWSKNHNKFYVFSQTYDSKNVVVQTSGNATGGMYNQFNDAYTTTDAKLYGAFRSYFYDQAKKTPNKDYWRTITSGGTTASFFPKAAGDPIVDILGRVNCAGGTKLRLTSGLFTRDKVAAKLSELDHDGCDVQIASGSLGESVAKKLTMPGKGDGPQVRYFAGANVQAAHSKYLLIDGLYAGKKRRLVVTGSHSYTWDALRNNDEAMLSIDNAATFNAYAGNFARVFAAAKGRLQVGSLIKPPLVSDGAPSVENEVPNPALPTAPNAPAAPTPPGAQEQPAREREAGLPPVGEAPEDGPLGQAVDPTGPGD
ncbi:phospholipase D-like domain-containing protein [Actinomadura flavalba]|uniref:phospholipase D-like domain-containing protein n=1 Tax=Actinomadura flavalba TaxID=1120938 RepID=UPI0003AAA3A6|nr:phospholipase D-like domain-containing protein [Actinomadura flavalba]